MAAQTPRPDHSDVDNLTTVLLRRLCGHIKKVETHPFLQFPEKDAQSFVWDFARSNMASVACVLTWMGFVNTDTLANVVNDPDDKTCLLSDPTFVAQDGDVPATLDPNGPLRK